MGHPEVIKSNYIVFDSCHLFSSVPSKDPDIPRHLQNLIMKQIIDLFLLNQNELSECALSSGKQPLKGLHRNSRRNSNDP